MHENKNGYEPSKVIQEVFPFITDNQDSDFGEEMEASAIALGLSYEWTGNRDEDVPEEMLALSGLYPNLMIWLNLWVGQDDKLNALVAMEIETE